MNSELTPDRTQAEQFLKQLDPTTDKFTFQIFDDNADRKDPALSKVLHGSLAEHWDTLVDRNRRGAGIFVTVNETDFKNRRANNIVRVRALWQEDDNGTGASVLPVKPHIVVESSPGKFHRYILISDVPLEEFDNLQQSMVDHYGSDPNAKDIARVLRLPGFYHQKINSNKGITKKSMKPFMVRLVDDE